MIWVGIMNLGQQPTATGDIVAGAGTAAAIFGYLVNVISPLVVLIVGILAAIYYLLHILDHPVLKRWVHARAQRIRAKKITRLQYRQKILIGELEKLGALERAEVTPKTTTVEMKHTSDAYNEHK